MTHEPTFAEKIIRFNVSLEFTGELPDKIAVMNPFRENCCATPASEAFYRKYYNDRNSRYAIFGINPGRFGAGITGVPFTDPVRLKEECGIDISSCPIAREPSSVFVYEMIHAYGGVREFYASWYINSICPLGFTRDNAQGKPVNFNYYDNAALQKAVTPFIEQTFPEQIDCGLRTSVCFCFGKGKNFAYMQKLNSRGNYFKKIIPLDHPRFIVQYKSGQMKEYAKNYARELKEVASTKQILI